MWLNSVVYHLVLKEECGLGADTIALQSKTCYTTQQLGYYGSIPVLFVDNACIALTVTCSVLLQEMAMRNGPTAPNGRLPLGVPRVAVNPKSRR